MTATPRPATSSSIVDGETAEFRRVTYDVEATQRQMLDAGLPPRLAERLGYGR